MGGPSLRRERAELEKEPAPAPPQLSPDGHQPLGLIIFFYHQNHPLTHSLTLTDSCDAALLPRGRPIYLKARPPFSSGLNNCKPIPGGNQGKQRSRQAPAQEKPLSRRRDVAHLSPRASSVREALIVAGASTGRRSARRPDSQSEHYGCALSAPGDPQEASDSLRWQQAAGRVKACPMLPRPPLGPRWTARRPHELPPMPLLLRWGPQSPETSQR